MTYSTTQEDKQVANAKGAGFFPINKHYFLLLKGRKNSFILKRILKTRALKHVLSTFENQRKYFLIKITPLRLSFKSKFIQIYPNGVKLVNSIEI